MARYKAIQLWSFMKVITGYKWDYTFYFTYNW